VALKIQSLAMSRVMAKMEKRQKIMPTIRIELMTLSLLVIRSTTEPSGLFW
jgi:hypothetical protein